MKPLLILDLDETLAHASARPLPWPPAHRGVLGTFELHPRPGLDRFLRGAAELFDLAVWSSASARYLDAVLALIWPADLNRQFSWGRERCTPRFDPEFQETVFLKKLEKLKRAGRRLDRVLMVDDSPEKLTQNYGNLVRIEPFLGDPDDAELAPLLDYLTTLAAQAGDFRSIEKRGWRWRHGNPNPDHP